MAQTTQSNGTHLRGQSADTASHQPNGGSTHSAADDSQAGVAEHASTAAQAESAEATKLQSNLKARRRTKTGCLTCRKRRIKCGEERPTCANCIKSKRSCEGYAPRLTFKDPLGAFRPGWAIKGHGAHYQNYPNSNGAIGQYTRQPAPPGAPSQLPIIAPRPLPAEPSSDAYLPSDMPPTPWSAGLHSSTQHGLPPQNGPSPQNGMPTQLQPLNDLPPRMRQMYQKQTYPSDNALQHVQMGEMTADFALSGLPYTMQDPNKTLENRRPLGIQPSVRQWTSSSILTGSAKAEPVQASDGAADQYGPTLHDTRIQDHYQDIPPEDNNNASGERVDAKPPVGHAQRSLNSHVQQEYQYFNPIIQGVSDSPEHTFYADGNPLSYTDDEFGDRPQVQELGNSYTEVFQKQVGFKRLRHQLINVADDPEDDLYDVESDEDGVTNLNRAICAPQNDVGLMLALAASQDDRVLRSYTTFLNEPNVLSTYHPAYAASPLMDSTTARVFCHFITATGPSMSIYERHPINPSVMFTGAPVPSSQQSLWTYSLPMRALSNQALLHAMLAIASLHISALQKTPPTASLKHYHFALRRLTKILSIPSKRTDIGTIAATLILGHYESTTAEHSKWNQHLAGARQLLMEVDFKGLTKQIKKDKARKRRQTPPEAWYSGESTVEFHSFQQGYDTPKEEEVNEAIVSQLMGWEIKYDEYGGIVNEYTDTPRVHITEKDIEMYKIQSDLFWWYAKQDVYQSVVSGNPLLLPYDRWGHCPPRAPIGRLDTIYGSMDHLVLLMGRIADFASRDQVRKRKVMKKNGGHWRPPPGMFPSPASSRGPPPGFSNQAQGGPPGMPLAQPPQPPMYGMIPLGPAPRTPDRFMQVPRDQIYVPPTIDEDSYELEEAAAEAEAEWRSIQDALSLFERSLGPGYASLPDYLAPPFDTPFGVALQYRTWSIACIWVMYHTGRIIATRMHPSMPPAALMAAGVAAPQTAHYATTIGRICCGLQIPPSDQPLNPAVGAALMESTLGMFFAGVQYTDPVQRSAIVDRLLTIAEMTGLQSSALIAAGCELCWVKMGEAGRGPPYTPTMDKKAKDDRVAGRPAPKGDLLDRQLIFVNPGTRTHYAMGVLGLESDFSSLNTDS